MNSKIEKLTNIISSLKKGSKIHIKKENRGKFTDYCGGKVTSECIARGKSSPNPAIRKRATFAANARKWKHAEGGNIQSDPIFKGIKTTNNRPYNPIYISYINNKLREAGMSKNKRTAVLANIIEESGGDPFAKGPGGYYGLLQWSNARYVPTNERNVYAELDNQINYILQTEGNANDRQSWTHGGKGSGYNSLKDAMNAFNSDILNDAVRGFTLGYVRPAGALDSLNNRTAVANQINNLSGYYQKGGNLAYTPFGVNEQENKHGLTYKPYLKPSEQVSDLQEVKDLIYNYTPSFPVVPVKTYEPEKKEIVEETPVVKKEQTSKIEKVQTPEFEVQQVVTPRDATAVAQNVEKILGTIEYKTSNMDVGNMQELIDLMRDEGISFRVTSGKREGAKTSNGSKSHHSMGNAIDITPIKGQSWEDLIAQMKRSSKFLEYMRSHGLGILDERSKEMLSKTGGTGAHFHIGPDKAARQNFITLFG